MKQLVNYIKESQKISMPELPHNDGKNEEKIAYDTNGDGWIVQAYCYADGSSPEGCNSINELLKTYDTSGAMKDCLDKKNVNDDTIIVGAYMAEDEDELAAWVWGYDGICYENKKYK